jgi:hypothetical protein
MLHARHSDSTLDCINMGRNPITGQIAFDPHAVKDMLSIMFSCGMYDYSGQWGYRVGVPAKSGVGGGIIAVVNRSSASARTRLVWTGSATAAEASRSACSWPLASGFMCSTA